MDVRIGIKGAVGSFIQGLFGTRQQVVYAVVGSYVFLLIKGAMLAKSSDDIVSLLNVAWLGVGAVLAAWFGDRTVERGSPDSPVTTVRTKAGSVDVEIKK